MMPVPRRPKRATDPKAVAPPDGAHKKPPPGPLEPAENGASQPHLPVANGAATPHEIAAPPLGDPAPRGPPRSARPGAPPPMSPHEAAATPLRDTAEGSRPDVAAS